MVRFVAAVRRRPLVHVHRAVGRVGSGERRVDDAAVAPDLGMGRPLVVVAKLARLFGLTDAGFFVLGLAGSGHERAALAGSALGVVFGGAGGIGGCWVLVFLGGRDG